MSSQPSRSAGELSAAERAFYSRQLILPEMGYEAQLALKGARGGAWCWRFGCSRAAVPGGCRGRSDCGG